MARNELVQQLKLEITKYLGVPYFINNPRIPSSPINAFVGKGTSQEIAQATISTAQKLKINLVRMGNRQIYNFQKKNHIGIDCSGLAYHLENFIYQYKTGKSLDDCLIGTEGKSGVRRLSADLLTSPPNASSINDYSQIKTGDLIRIDQGNHVIIVIEKIGNKIYYVHSSDRTLNRGVHLGSVTITDPTKTLDLQTWSDTTSTGKPYNQFFNPTLGDGMFRLNCIK